jgi:hypothetical protein
MGRRAGGALRVRAPVLLASHLYDCDEPPGYVVRGVLGELAAWQVESVLDSAPWRREQPGLPTAPKALRLWPLMRLEMEELFSIGRSY